LKYHLSAAAMVSPEQTQRYLELRGYAEGSHAIRHHPHR
jgi:hypothetical protein